jgi:hypothetical protein
MEYLELAVPSQGARNILALVQLSMQMVVSLDDTGCIIAWPFV